MDSIPQHKDFKGGSGMSDLSRFECPCCRRVGRKSSIDEDPTTDKRKLLDARFLDVHDDGKVRIFCENFNSR